MVQAADARRRGLIVWNVHAGCELRANGRICGLAGAEAAAALRLCDGVIGGVVTGAGLRYFANSLLGSTSRLRVESCVVSQTMTIACINREIFHILVLRRTIVTGADS